MRSYYGMDCETAEFLNKIIFGNTVIFLITLIMFNIFFTKFIHSKIVNYDSPNNLKNKNKRNKIFLLVSLIIIILCLSVATFIEIKTSFNSYSLIYISSIMLIYEIISFITETLDLIIKIIKKQKNKIKYLKYYVVVAITFLFLMFFSNIIWNLCQEYSDPQKVYYTSCAV